MCVPLVSHARTHARGRRRRSRERDQLDPVRPSLSLVASHGCWVAQDPLQKPRSHLTLAVAALLPSLAWKGKKRLSRFCLPHQFPTHVTPSGRARLPACAVPVRPAPPRTTALTSLWRSAGWVAAAVHVARRKAEAAPATRHGLPSKLIGTPH
jgi:hypothetical protein